MNRILWHTENMYPIDKFFVRKTIAKKRYDCYLITTIYQGLRFFKHSRIVHKRVVNKHTNRFRWH